MVSKKKGLQVIPGVGPRVDRLFQGVNVRKVSDLKDKDPEDIYNRMCLKEGGQLDRCVLYVCRCSVYYASNKKLDSEKLKWWNWKDK